MVSSSNRMAPVLEVAHVLMGTLIARPVPTVQAVTVNDGQSISMTVRRQYSPSSSGMIEVGVLPSGGLVLASSKRFPPEGGAPT